MSGNRRDRKDSDNDNDNSSNSIGMVVAAGIGIGAVLYGVSKLFGSGSSSEKPPQAIVHQREATRSSQQARPRVIDVIEMEHQCVRAIDRIERFW